MSYREGLRRPGAAAQKQKGFITLTIIEASFSFVCSPPRRRSRGAGRGRGELLFDSQGANNNYCECVMTALHVGVHIKVRTSVVIGGWVAKESH